MRFSVIVPFLNEEPYISACARGILHQHGTAGDHEAIFVDNGSTDGSCDQLAAFPRIRVITCAQGNVYHARNRAAAEASGEVLVFTDGDCVPSPEWLLAVEEALADPDCDLVTGPRLFHPERSRWLEVFEWYENAKAEYVFRHDLGPWLFGYTNNLAVRANVFHAVGGFAEDEPVSADTDFVQRVWALSARPNCCFHPEMRVVHLEVRSFVDWMNKLFVYGQANERLMASSASYHPLSVSMRREVAGRVLERVRPLPRAAMLGALGLGQLAYWAGAAKTRIGRHG